METFVFLSITWERNILLAQIENICFICPISVGIKDNVVFCFPAIFVLLFFIFFCPFFFFSFLFLDRDLCTKRGPSWESRTCREHKQTRESQNPNLSAKVHKGSKTQAWKWLTLTLKTHSQKKKKLHYPFAVQEKRGNNAMWGWKLFRFFFNFAFTFWPFHKWTDWTLAPNRWEQKKENRKKNNNKYYKLISFLFWIPQEVLVPSLWHLCLLTPQAQWDLVRE